MAAGRRVRCFMDIDVGAGHVSRIIVELYNELCPKTCENFRALCTGELGMGKTSNKPLNYKGTILHRVIKGFMIQGGDISGASGRGGESIYGGLFEDENLKLTHDKPHLLSMANRGPNANGSQFFITTAAAPHLDSRNVVFGEVISGENIIALIENVPVDRTSRPLADIKIIKCGQLVLSSKSKVKKKKRAKRGETDSSSSSDSSDSASEKETPLKEHRKKDKKCVDKPDQLKEPKAEVHPLEDIPAIPMNRLFRGEGSRADHDQNAGKDREKPRDRNQYRDKDRNDSRGKDRDRSGARVFVRGVTKSGRNIKGRGVFRYRTPSRSRSRSATPPHWKLAQRRTIKMAEFKQKTKEQIEFSEELKRREQARNARHSTIQHSKSQENAPKLNTDSKESHDKISEINDLQINSNQEDIHKSSKGSKVDSKPDPLSDLEEGETRDEDVVIKEEDLSSPSHMSMAVDYNALDYEAPTEIQDIATNGATTSDDFPDKDLRESWDSKRQSAPSPDEDSDAEVDSKKKHRSSKVKDTPSATKESLSPSAKDVLKLKDSRLTKSHKTPCHEEETQVQKLSEVKSDVNNKISIMSEDTEDALKKEVGKSEERRKEEEKEWIEMMGRKREEELMRKRALESGRKMLQQKKRDKLRDIVKKKEKEEELRKVSRDNSKKSKRRAPSTSSSGSSSSNSSSKRRHSLKSHSRRTSVKQRRSRSPARRSRSPIIGSRSQARKSRSPIIGSRSQARKSRSPIIGSRSQARKSRSPIIGSRSQARKSRSPIIGSRSQARKSRSPIIGSRSQARKSRSPIIGSRSRKSRSPIIGSRSQARKSRSPIIRSRARKSRNKH